MSTSNNNGKKSGLEIFFTEVFGMNLKTLFLTNLLLDIPIVIAVGIVTLISYLLGGIYTIVAAMVIPLVAPFTAGVFYIVRNILRKKETDVLRDFKRGVKDNAFQFTIQGIINYLVFVGFYIAFSFYQSYLPNPIVIAALVPSILVAIVYAFMVFNMGMMTVTVKLKQIDIYKNSLLLSFIAIIQNGKTLISLLFIGTIIFCMILVMYNIIAILCTIAALVLLILPTFVILVIGYNSYPAVKDFVIDSKADFDKDERDYQQKEDAFQMLSEEELESFAKGDPNEYVYVDGKMIKRSAVKKMLEKMREE